MNAPLENMPKLPALQVGGSVAGIIPKTIEDMWRISTMVVRGGLAPSALIGKKVDEEAVSAICIAIMSGAELGLPPLVALRSFTVINGRPALYGDGLINVVRRSKTAAYVRTGCDQQRMVGFCEAKRSDTGEELRVEFSKEDAIRAGLWDQSPTRRGKVWEDNKQVWRNDVPNDTPWFRYPQRMLAWRAAGYCLRELFADVLGGIQDEFEAREIEGEYRQQEATPMRDVSPSLSPPSPPAEEQEADPSQHPEDRARDGTASQESEGEGATLDYGAFFTSLQERLEQAGDEGDVEDVWTELDVEAALEGDDDSRQLADGMKARRLKALGIG